MKEIREAQQLGGPLPCPFCGGMAEVLRVNYCCCPGIQIRCTKCHASTQTLMAGDDPRTGKITCLVDLQVRVEQLWNRRAAV